MIWVLGGVRSVVSVVIITLNGVSFIPREAASRLIPLQKFLTREIERREQK